MMRRLQHLSGHRRGFTLVELMVTVLVGSIVVAGIYLLYRNSVKAYGVQDQNLGAIAQLRTAVQQVRMDLRSTGYNAPVQSDVETWVTTSPGITLSAIALDVDPDFPVANADANETIEPTRIRILGDFWAHRTFTSEAISGSVVTLSWGPDDGNEAEFLRIFNPRRLLRIETYGVARQEQILPIMTANFNGGISPTVTLGDNVQGIGGFGSGNEVTLVGYVRYRLKHDIRRNEQSVKYDLVREELDSDGRAIDGTALIIAENMVDLQVYDICLNTNTPEAGTMRQVPIVNGNTLRCFSTLEALESAGFSLKDDNTNDSHMLRALTVKMSARTPFEDPDIPFAPRLERDSPLRTFELEPDLQGAARVFELAAMVTLTSVQSRRQ